MNRCSRALLATLVLLTASAGLRAADQPEYRRTQDVVYGRKFGTALTFDVFTPAQNANGAAVIMVMSGGWFSAHEMINPAVFDAFLSRGYTVFAVVHGSQPKYTIPEILDDMHRSIRYIRHNAGDFGIQPDRIGITGGSAGGHLSLMMGTAGRPGDPNAKDPVDRQSSRVQAVGCYFPPTDFLNYGETGRDVFKALESELKPFKAPFDFVRLDTASGRFVRIEDSQARLDIARDISPITHVTPDDPPALIIHGDADKLVPIQQSQVFIKRLEEAGVENKLVVKPGEGHGWKDWIADMAIIADFFDVHLLGKQPATRPDQAEP
ncbi:MAG TPA: alpha/beta hydrolase [Phycisphaerae bacterium]|nr:alpha/beta hydrolase [Phycisphaerae bacterium]HOJ75231.1 alpha/beta hydrolase [Phycisphaerae bacterium]HOM52418.1 alpha/beta hydrolase [Phycisphaerae bacterium]HOQ87066.1 alpha/beta hydrolase [Phycisphaerae bacterium]HPP27692.1 alpha/beta hydrolase [Phycisphaerae bacterium]